MIGNGTQRRPTFTTIARIAAVRAFAARAFAVWAVAAAMAPPEAAAHPHVWVTARTQLVFAQDKLTAVRHSWTFDPAYSQYATQGLDADGDGKPDAAEMADLARSNIEGLYEFDFFTKVKANGKSIAFTRASDPSLELVDGSLVLHFTLPVEPAVAAGRALALEIYDPTYFVSFVFAPGADAATTAGTAGDCAITITRPKQQDFNAQDDLSEAFFNALTAASSFGQDFATRAVVACP
ncbi:MAG: DUF1007 family protein [Pseudochelatococcus sp.]|jgi:ABC-type uncharacterized transport system substrate-binding protein|uniref:DUF1007 family protein n=1 Tax=Pseudochelatococcus sp. TaxID=2020869 RepID=UPI003D9316E0